MEITSTKYSKYKIFIITVCILACVQVLFLSSAFAQLDYYYGKNNKGFRIGGGPGISALFTHYATPTLSIIGTGDIDYAFNPYFSIGINGQVGSLVGKDATGTFYYEESKDSYMYGNMNMKFGLGLITDFDTRNGFMDALKRFYMGVGAGIIKTNNTLTASKTVSFSNVYPDPAGDQRVGSFKVLTVNYGTYIDLRGLWGSDKVELCPNFQFNYVNTYYLDGYKSNANSTLKGIFTVSSLTLRYKFQ